MSQDLVVKHNKVIESKYNMTSTEAKIIAKLTSMIEKNDAEFQDYNFKAKELLEELGLGENYTLLKKAIKKLITREIEIEEEKENIVTTVLSSCRYSKEDSTIKLRYDPVLKPYFLQLKKHFTKYHIKNVLELNSFYSIRIYELLKQYQKIKKRKFKLEKIRKLLDIESKYKLYGHLKARVIKPAVEEINEKTDLQVDFEEIKTGRKVTAIQFLIKQKKEIKNKENELSGDNNQQNSSKSPESDQKREEYKLDKLYHLLPEEEQIESNKDTLAELLKNYEYKYIKADIKYANRFNLENFMGFLVESCKNGHFGKAILEKEEKKKKSIKKKKEEEKMRAKAKKEKQKAIEEIVATKCENLAEEKKKKLKKRYNYLIETDSSEIAFEDRADKMFAENHSFEEFLGKHFKAQENIL